MKHIRYSMQGAYAEGQASRHPQDIMKALGITYQHTTPQSMYDQWWFWNCENVPEDMPEFLSELKLDPMECIGNGLSQDAAEKIRDYAQQLRKDKVKTNLEGE